ncbi:uncharacterized protein [Drosophila tropicalis]|uniref:uncharacterized protein n=1 Tax=Drosophila tropicalis TaxID=46794 RepID=UPI0035ABA0CF
MYRSHVFYYSTIRLLSLLLLDGKINRTLAIEYQECLGVDVGTYVASKMNCAKYIYCAGEGSFEGECLSGHFYDVDLDRCMNQELVLRCGGTTTKQPSSTPKETSKNSIKVTTSKPTSSSFSVTLHELPIANPCLAYMVCYEGAGMPRVCSPTRLMSCTQRQTLRPVVACRKGVYDFVPHPLNCAYFYYCSNGSKKLHRCPLTFTWNYQQRACVQQGQRKCFRLNTNRTRVKKFVFN